VRIVIIVISRLRKRDGNFTDEFQFEVVEFAGEVERGGFSRKEIGEGG